MIRSRTVPALAAAAIAALLAAAVPGAPVSAAAVTGPAPPTGPGSADQLAGPVVGSDRLRPDLPGVGGAWEFGPDGRPGFHVLWGVAAIDADDALSVGIGGDDLSVRARHWDGTRWVPTDPPGGSVSEMYAVHAISPTDAWGVGNAQGDALLNHWDGTAWTRVPAPPREPGTGDFPRAVDSAGTDDVWAVGFTMIDGSDVIPLIEHWDGTTWEKVPYQLPYGNTLGYLEGVSVVSATDAWAVGYTYPHNAPLILHWDGRRWVPVTDIISPTGGYLTVLNAVTAVSADDVWAVGAGGGAAIVHWDGRVWSRVPVPPRDVFLDGLFGVSAISADDVWAVGGYGQRGYYTRTQALHWDGHSWERVPTPRPRGRTQHALYAVSAAGPDDVWAVGSLSNNNQDTQIHLYLHWDGERWTRVRSAVPEK